LPDPTGGDYSARPEPLAGRGQPISKWDRREGEKRGNRIEKAKGIKGREEM